MNLAEFSLRNRVTTLLLTVVTVVAGLMAYQNLGRLEDPTFTIKLAVISTPYPGATADEVELEVTDRIEKAIQQLGQLKRIKESRSMDGMSIVKAEIQDRYDAEGLPQVWDELRRKVGDVQRQLPPGAGPSLVNDDFGDVFGVYFALHGTDYSYPELYEVADFLGRELALETDVAKVQLFGVQSEEIVVTLDRDRMSQLSLAPTAVIRELRDKNMVVDAGRVEVDGTMSVLRPTGVTTTTADYAEIMIRGDSGNAFRLGDLADIRRRVRDPARPMLHFDGEPAVGIGISTTATGNVVTMGEAIQRRLGELEGEIPLGMDLGVIAMQSESVVQAIDSFISSLLQAVVIVVVVLLFFMGLRSGLLIGFILFQTICITFIVMAWQGIPLERISLGALIIALGMLVDNAIVVVDGVLSRQAKGEDAASAGIDIVGRTGTALAGATVIAILAFAAIGTSQDSTGEFTRSLFYVILYSLSLSWVTAVTVTPVLATWVLKQPDAPAEGSEDEGPTGFLGAYRRFLHVCLRRRWMTVGAVVAMFAAAVWGFGYVPGGFFPASTRAQFMVDIWLPQGTHIDTTREQAALAEDWLQQQEGVRHVATSTGGGGLRFILTYTPETSNDAFAQVIVDFEDYETMLAVRAKAEEALPEVVPGSVVNVKSFLLGPNEGGRIQVRLQGEDADVLREIGDEALSILYRDPGTKAAWLDWRNRVPTLVPRIAVDEANANGIQRRDVAEALREGFEGLSVGMLRDGDLLLPVVLQQDAEFRTDPANLQNVQIWSPVAQRMIPIRQVVSGFDVVPADSLLMRRDRKRTLTIHADQATGPASELFARVKPQLDAMVLPPGYVLEHGGEYEDSNNAQAGIGASLPMFVLMMFLMTVALFNAMRPAIIIWLCVPLAIIGVSPGLALSGNPFDFMAVLGFMSLMGMLIKNAIVLIDEINALRGEGVEPLQAVLDAGVSRLTPVAMAASTTALGMIPLLPDVFFRAMAITIIGGLLFATVLTMLVVPTLYVIFFKIEA